MRCLVVTVINRKFPIIYSTELTNAFLKRMVGGFLLKRQKNSSKILRKNFFNVIGCSCPHIITIVNVGVDYCFDIVT